MRPTQERNVALVLGNEFKQTYFKIETTHLDYYSSFYQMFIVDNVLR